MKKCNCKIMNTLGKYQKIWPWIGVAGYAVDGAEAVLKHTKWGKAHYKLRMLIHGAGAGLLCLGAGVHTVQAFTTGKADVPAIVSGCIGAAVFSRIGTVLDTALLKKLFGALLIATGLRELLYKPKT